MENIYNALKTKYNYDLKTIKALKTILPSLLEYYGMEEAPVIINAINNCEIKCCSSYQTPSSIIEKYNPYQNDSFEGSTYYSYPIIKYNELKNSFEVQKVEKMIIIPHMYNLDSPKGIEVLTNSLCELIKSHQNEYKINNNFLYKRTGLYEKKYQIIYDLNNLSLSYISDKGYALQKGINMYDTGEIVSSALKDKYKMYGYDSLYTIAMILKEKFNLKRSAEISEIQGINTFKDNEYYNDLASIVDKCYCLEEDMLNPSRTRKEKEDIKNKIKTILCTSTFQVLLDFRRNQKNIKNKKS